MKTNDSDKYWQHLVTALADGVIISHQDGTILYANRNAELLFGRSASELIGENFLYPLAANKTQEIEIIKPNGQVFNAEMNVKLGAWKESKAWIISLRDITEKKQKIEQLEIGAKVFNHAHEGIMVTDANCNLVDVNPAFTAMTGYSKIELLGKNPRIVKSGRHPPIFYKRIWQSITDTGFWSGEIWEKHKNGTIFPVYLSISSVKNSDGEIINYIGCCYDLILLKKKRLLLAI